MRERSKMVLILAEPDADALTRLDEIVEEYSGDSAKSPCCGLRIRHA